MLVQELSEEAMEISQAMEKHQAMEKEQAP